MSEIEQQTLREKAKISLWLDDYTDIFSDFDPRPYGKRTLSDDFIYEVKKVSRETVQGGSELRLLLPEAKRKDDVEAIIRRRLKEFFKKQYNLVHEKKDKILKQGWFFILLGIALMLFTTYVLFKSWGENFLITFLSVIAEPAGWFLFWEGLNLVIFGSKEIKNDLDFTEKMIYCKIYFLSD